MKSLVLIDKESGIVTRVGDDGVWVEIKNSLGQSFVFQPATQFIKVGLIGKDTIQNWCAELQQVYFLKKQDLLNQILQLENLNTSDPTSSLSRIYELANSIMRNPMSSLEEQIMVLKKLDETVGDIGEYNQQAVDNYLESIEGL